MQFVGVRIAKNRDSAVPESLSRAHDPAGDLATIGDQDFAESGHHRELLGKPACARRVLIDHSTCATQDGFRFSTNALVPSRPSELRTAVAKASAAAASNSGMAFGPAARSISRLLAAIAAGAHLSTWLQVSRKTASSAAASATARCAMPTS